MRTSLWMIPVVLLLTVLGNISASADTIIASGGNVTAIDGITIAGTTYNVTFGTTEDTTFSGDLTDAATAYDDIFADLTSSSTYVTVGGEYGVIVNASPDFYLIGEPSADGDWTMLGEGDIDPIGLLPGGFFIPFVISEPALFAEFSVVPVATPEPGSVMLLLTGLVLLGLMYVWRKRKAPALAQAT